MTTDFAVLYRRLRAKMIVYLERRGCTDSEEVADEALYRAFVKPGVGDRKIESIEAFAFGVLKHVHHEWLRRTRRLAPLEERTAESTTAEEPLLSPELLDLRTMLDRLPARDRELLIRYYVEKEKAKDLGPHFGLTAAGVRTRVRNLRILIREMLARSRPSDELCETPVRFRDTFRWRREKRLCH